MTPAQYNEYQRQADVIEQAKKWKEENQLKEMTAVEFLVINIKPFKYKRNEEISHIIDIIELARQMEKKQIIDAFDSTRILTAEQYYQKTFKNKLK